MWSNVAFSAFLVLVSVVLTAVQLRGRPAAGRQGLDERDRQFLRGQFRRRMQVDVMIGVTGVAILGGLWVGGREAKIVYWSVVLLLGVWIGLLALADIVSTRLYLRRLHQSQVAKFRELRAEISRIRTARRGGNGKADCGGAGDHQTR